MKTTVVAFLLLGLFGKNISLYRNHIYVNMYLTWTDAQNYCREHHDDLSTITNQDLQPLSDYPKDYSLFYIGLYRDPRHKNVWKWSTGESATIDSWDIGEPASSEQCGGAKNSKFHGVPCHWEIPFFCMEVFELFVVHQESTWEEALLYCRRHYTDLAVLNSDVSMAEIVNKSTAAQTEDVWIGLRFIAGHWFWVNGADLQYNVWSLGRELQCPALNQRCGVYNVKQRTWKPTACERRLNFLCLMH